MPRNRSVLSRSSIGPTLSTCSKSTISNEPTKAELKTANERLGSPRHFWGGAQCPPLDTVVSYFRPQDAPQVVAQGDRPVLASVHRRQTRRLRHAHRRRNTGPATTNPQSSRRCAGD